MHLIDWEHPEKNDFALAEEVTLKGGYERRPDIVLYINGIAVAVIELKRSSVEIGRRRAPAHHQPGRDLQQGVLQHGAARCWRAATRKGCATAPPARRSSSSWSGRTKRRPAAARQPPGRSLDRPLAQLCNKARLLDLIRNFIIFDAGQKKVPRPHQFFGVKAAQERIAKREGGVIWHTQGSGKSILMVLLAKWLLEHDPDGPHPRSSPTATSWTSRSKA